MVEHLGPHVPIHFTAYQHHLKMLNHSPTPPSTLNRARRIAMKNGIHYAYTGNVNDEKGGSTYCPQCGQKLIGRDWYTLGEWSLTADGRCNACGTPCAGVFEARPGAWGARRRPVRLRQYAD